MEQIVKKNRPFWEDSYQQLMLDLEAILQKQDTNIVNKATKAIVVCKESMQSLRDRIVQYKFTEQQEEIFFFKLVKPKFYSRLIYFHKLFNIEIARPVGNLDDQKAFLQKELERVKEFFDENKFFYQYFRSGQTYLDDKLFMRHRQDIPLYAQIIDINAHPAFTTNSDYIFSSIRANELIVSYLNTALGELNEIKQPTSNTPPAIKKLKWTDPKSGLIEYIYGFKAMGCFNDGKATTKEITEYFELVFDVKINNASRDLQEILRRKTGYTIHMDGLKKSYLKYIDSIEDKERR